MTDLYSKISEAADFIKQQFGNDLPDTAMILGSGLGSLIDGLSDSQSVNYADIPNFPVPTVAGHQGQIIKGNLNGYPVFCMQGRVHSYEGLDHKDLSISLRALSLLGVKRLIITSAVGSLREDMGPGSVMLVRDHINWGNVNPLIGNTDSRFGDQFTDMTHTYSEALADTFREAAANKTIKLHEGVFLIVTGPNFETPAEIRAFQILGGDVVGMSMVPEAMVARHAGMEIAALSMVTNLAAGMTGQALSHAETLSEGQKAAQNLSALLHEFMALVKPAN
ncbi:MAG: purine-nucleoside phosphorylase [Gammaproteobacteria bacterium]|nr:purine-nucleoside phosphorylase [Gammaproteobacteria bacterium]